MKRTLAIGIIMVLLLAGIGSVSANLVSNGGFESPAISGDYNTYYAGDTALSPWIIEAGSIDLIRGYWDAPEEDQSIDLAGFYQEGSIRQGIPTSDTKSYDLSFAMAGNPDSGPAIKKVQVWWDGSLIDTFTFDTSGKTHSDMGWTTKNAYNLPGKTGSQTTELKFVDTTETGTAFGTALDNIVVEEHVTPVPEFPAITLPVMFIIGLFGAILLIQQSRED